MLTEIQDPHVIFARAVEIASETEREAYLTQACGQDAALRQRVEELLTAHFHGQGPDRPAVASVPPSASPKRHPETTGSNHTNSHVNSSAAAHPPEKAARKPPRGLVTVGVLLLLTVTAGSVGVAGWAWRAEEQARAAAEQAVDESKRARKAQEEAEHQLEQALARQQSVSKQRDEALEEEKAEQHSEQDIKTVLAFIQAKLLSAARPVGWPGGQGKDVTLRKAVDAAEAKVAEAFAEHPLAEAAIRELLGLTYLDFGEAALAVRQHERALTLREAFLGVAHPDTSDSRNKLAVAYRLADRHDDASRLFDPERPSASHAAALAIRGSMLLSQNKPAEAEGKLRECLALRQKIQPDGWATFEAQVLLGEALQAQKKYAEAEPSLLSGYKGMKKHESDIPPQDRPCLGRAIESLVQLYETWGKNDAAAKWRKELAALQLSKKP